MRTGVRRNQRENYDISEERENQVDLYAALRDRMTRLIDALSPHQRDYHAVLQVDIYWYIQKQKEVEIMANRVLKNDNEILKRYLSTLCDDILQRIDADEHFAREYCNRIATNPPRQPGEST